MDLKENLFAMQDLAYREFICPLVPTVPPERIIGIRTPLLRKLAKEVKKSPEIKQFLQRLPHRYYEEDCLQAFLIEQIRDYSDCIEALNAFLPYVDNWAVCDSMSPKVLGKHRQELLQEIVLWLKSTHTYTIRFGIKMLMTWYLDDAFAPEYPQLVSSVISEEYYVNMMIAWYFATALAKQYEAVLPFLQENRLSKWVHNKTIQKAVESYRITSEQKAYLRTLRRK